MTEWTSLFARKLRAHRAGHGRHGRMTQEALAELLDVSVDAVSKYERSLSYIRGDLEHRLTERLGWGMEDVLACREDWEAGRSRPSGPSHRLLSELDILAEFDGSRSALVRAIAKMETGEASALPDGFSANDAIWCDIAGQGALTGTYVMYGHELVGHVGLVFPNADLEARFRERRLEEGELAPDLLRRAILPGDYFAYCPAVYIARGHEAAGRLLLSGVVNLLEDLVDREVFLRDIGATSVNALGRQLCEDLGLEFLGRHRRYDGFGIWILPGAGIAGSILARRSAKLRNAYRARAWRDEQPLAAVPRRQRGGTSAR